MRLTSLLLCLLFLASCSGSKTAASGASGSSGEKDLIVVLDTSLSMTGDGGSNIMPQVKQSLSVFVDRLGKGDTFTFITFDEQTRVYPTVTIDNISKADVIKKYITMVEAKGMWTYTMDMLATVVAKAEEISAADPGRELMIVILTDALDDPPPAAKKKLLNIKDIAKGDPKDWYIYFVNLGEFKANARMKGLAADLNKGLGANAQVVDAKGDVAKAIETDMTKELDERDAAARSSLLKKFLLVVGILVLIAFLIWLILFIRKSQLKLYGYLAYRPADMLRAEVHVFALAQAGSSIVTIGRNSLDTVKLLDFTSRKAVIIKATRFPGGIKPVLDEDNGAEIHFVRDKKEAFLTDGDAFIAGGYQFTFSETDPTKTGESA